MSAPFFFGMEILTHIPFTVDWTRLLREAHVEAGSENAAELLALAERAAEVGRPKAAYTEAFVEPVGEDTVRIGGRVFTSRVLKRNLAEVGRVFPVLMTCGNEMDAAYPADGEVLRAYWRDLLKSQMLSAAVESVGERVRQRYRLGKTAMMLPGSGDVTVWPIEQQRELFALLGEASAAIGVTLTDSCLMIPNKTLSGILFATQSDFRGCEVCHRENCASRKAPSNPRLWQTYEGDAVVSGSGR